MYDSASTSPVALLIAWSIATAVVLPLRRSARAPPARHAGVTRAAGREGKEGKCKTRPPRLSKPSPPGFRAARAAGPSGGTGILACLCWPADAVAFVAQAFLPVVGQTFLS